MMTHTIIYTKNCPQCGGLQTYSCRDSWRLNTKTNSTCKKCSAGRQAEEKRQSELGVLLEDTPLTYYWLGFIMADGHIDHKRRLVVRLSVLDEEHLIRLKEYLKIDNITYQRSNTIVSISAMDTKIINILSDKFNISSRKTYNPCNIKGMSQDLLFSLMVGFIDGDGSIKYQSGRTDCLLQVKCHSSWLDNLQHMLGKPGYINAEGYANVNIGDNTLLREWKLKAISFFYFYRYAFSSVSKYEVTRERVERIKELIATGMTNTKIARELSVGDTAIHNLIKKHNLR